MSMSKHASTADYEKTKENLEIRQQLREREEEIEVLKSQLKTVEDVLREIKRFAMSGKASMEKIFGGRTFLPIIENVLRLVNEYQQERSNAETEKTYE